jgi:hypothetical protein
MTRMANRRLGAGLCVVFALSLGLLGPMGCGARALPSGSDSDEEGFGAAGHGGAGSNDPSAPGGSGSGSGAAPGAAPSEPGVPIDVDRVTLPPCTPGFPRSSANGRECTYILRQQCFQEQLVACACACSDPDANSCITGGFLNPDEPQSVICITL